MEKMSRMSKYKDLREGIKTDVVSNQTATAYTQKEEIVKDADYYKRFLASEEAALNKPTQLKNAVSEDTLVESITLDTLNSQVDEELERALTRVRQESGQEDFNTRMDILNKIRQSKMIQETEEVVEEVVEDVTDDLEEDDDEEEQDSGRRFGFFKRHQDEEDDDEEYEDDEDDDEPRKKRFGFFKHHDEEDDVDDEEEIYDDDDDDEEEGSSTFVKVLNGIIVVLGLVLLALVGYIVKEFVL